MYNIDLKWKFDDETTMQVFNGPLRVENSKPLIFHFVNNLNQREFTDIFLECKNQKKITKFGINYKKKMKYVAMVYCRDSKTVFNFFSQRVSVVPA